MWCFGYFRWFFELETLWLEVGLGILKTYERKWSSGMLPVLKTTLTCLWSSFPVLRLRWPNQGSSADDYGSHGGTAIGCSWQAFTLSAVRFWRDFPGYGWWVQFSRVVSLVRSRTNHWLVLRLFHPLEPGDLQMLRASYEPEVYLEEKEGLTMLRRKFANATGGSVMCRSSRDHSFTGSALAWVLTRGWYRRDCSRACRRDRGRRGRDSVSHRETVRSEPNAGIPRMPVTNSPLLMHLESAFVHFVKPPKRLQNWMPRSFDS